jgi:hypothetical protein
MHFGIPVALAALLMDDRGADGTAPLAAAQALIVKSSKPR